MIHPVKLGRNTRMSYGKIREVIDMPNLIEIQKNSYNWFLEEGLKEVFHDVSPIADYAGNLMLEFVDGTKQNVYYTPASGRLSNLSEFISITETS